MPLFEKSPRNNGILTHNYDYAHSDNGHSLDEAAGIMLQPVDGQHQQQHSSSVPVVVSYGPGARTSTSVPQIVNYSQKSNLVGGSGSSGGRCYCKNRQIKSKMIVLAVAVLVMGTAIGALIMYFTGSFQCFDKNGEWLARVYALLLFFNFSFPGSVLKNLINPMTSVVGFTLRLRTVLQTLFLERLL